MDKDTTRAVGFCMALLVAAGVASRVMSPAWVCAVFVCLAAAGGYWLVAKTVRMESARTRDRLDDVQASVETAYRQSEALLALTSALSPSHPLPPMRGWAASPDFLLLLADAALAAKPRAIVEFGSGVTTLVSAYAIRKNGGGTVLSVDHDPAFAARTVELLRTHGLDDVACVVCAPLTADGAWYDLDPASLPSEIDLVVVDGPSYASDMIHPRYGAMPAVLSRLTPSARVLVDDGARAGEKRSVARWISENPRFEALYQPLEKGAYVIRRRTS